jgi:hypothetical protein
MLAEIMEGFLPSVAVIGEGLLINLKKEQIENNKS